VNIPNILTALRFILAPFFGYFLFIKDYPTAIALFLVGGVTDVLDGYIARKFDIVSSWGKLADPVADKIMQITALIILTYLNRVPLFIVIIVVAKETMMGLGSISLYRKANHVVSANSYGKFATVIFYLAVVLVIATGLKEPYSGILIGIAVLPTLFAFIMYFKDYKKIRNELK
jgi:cardiolipin synthase